MAVEANPFRNEVNQSQTKPLATSLIYLKSTSSRAQSGRRGTKTPSLFQGDPSGCKLANHSKLSGVCKMQRTFVDSLLAHTHRTTTGFRKNQKIFVEGDPSDSMFYIDTGRLKVSVTSEQGNEAILDVLGSGDFFGEDCLALEEHFRPYSAIAMSRMQCERIRREMVLGILQKQPEAASLFIQYLLRRNAQIQKRLSECLLGDSKQRLLHALSLLEKTEEGDEALKVSQQTLAEMIGTTRQRTNELLKSLRKRIA